MCILHKWVHVKGDFNLYYECSKCDKTKVKKGRGGYQPISWKPMVNPPKGK